MRKKLLFSLALTLLLASCFGPAKFDATNEKTAKESARKIAGGLPEDQREEFGKAIIYFTTGGSDVFWDVFRKRVGAVLSGNSPETITKTMLVVNLQSIDGLTGEQILSKYRARLEEDRLKREIEAAEKEKINSLKKEAQKLLKSNKFEDALAKYRVMSEISSGVKIAKAGIARTTEAMEYFREAAEKEKINSLEKEAQKLLESNKFEDALAKYKAMDEVSSGVKFAEAGIARTTEAMEDFTEKMNYIDKIQITEFVARRISPLFGEKDTPAVRISLKNTGDRSLDRVEVIVYFKDKEGNTIFEEDFYPVSVSQYSFGGDNKPLKPGYVKEMEKDKYYTIKSQLSEWAEGKATAKITDIKFSE